MVPMRTHVSYPGALRPHTYCLVFSGWNLWPLKLRPEAVYF